MTTKINPKGRNPLEDALSTAPWADSYFALTDFGNQRGPSGAVAQQKGNSQTTTATTTTTTTSSAKSINMMSPVLKPPTGNTGTPTDSYFSKQWNLTSTTAPPPR